MRARHYAQAIKSLLDSAGSDEAQERILSHAAKTIVANGHKGLIPRILKGLDEMFASERRKRTITVISAENVSEDAVAKLLKVAPYNAVLTGEHRFVERKTDPSLVGGIVVRTRARRADTSDKRALLDLYHHLTQ